MSTSSSTGYILVQLSRGAATSRAHTLSSVASMSLFTTLPQPTMKEKNSLSFIECGQALAGKILIDLIGPQLNNKFIKSRTCG